MNLNQTIEKLQNGGIILYPTDTIWGIGCDAINDEACQRINVLKNRPTDKSFILLVDSFNMVEKYVPDFHPVCYELVDISVRPLTIIYPNVHGIAPSVVAEDGSVGIRITKDPTCLKLIRSLKRPIVSTSANTSGKPNPMNFDQIEATIKKGVDVILEERTTEEMTTPSQIIKIELDGSVKVIRS